MESRLSNTTITVIAILGYVLLFGIAWSLQLI